MSEPGASDSDPVVLIRLEESVDQAPRTGQITALVHVLDGVITEMAANPNDTTSPEAVERCQFVASLVSRLDLSNQIFVHDGSEIERTPATTDNTEADHSLEGDREILLSSILTRLLNEQYPRTRRLVAERIGITESALSQYTRGGSTPKLTTLVALAKTLGVSLDFLVFGDSNPS